MDDSCPAAPAGTDHAQLGEHSDAALPHDDGLSSQAAALWNIGTAPTNADSCAAVHAAADACPPVALASWPHVAAAAVAARPSFVRIGR